MITLQFNRRKQRQQRTKRNCFLCLLLLNFLAPVYAAQINRIPPTTSYSRGLLTNETAVASRAYLQISDGLVYNFDPNSFYVVAGTNVFLLPGASLTNMILVGNTLNPQLDVGASSGVFNVNAALSTEFSMRLAADATLTFTNWNDWHPVTVTVTNTGTFSLTYGNTMFWVPNQNSTQVTNDWGVGAINIYHFYKDTGGNIVASDPERRATAGFTTINPTDGYIPVRTNGTTFVDSPFKVSSPGVLQYNGQAGWLVSSVNYGVGVGYLNGAGNGSYNVGVGYLSLQNNTSGAYNVAIGSMAGNQITDEQSNVYLGSVAGSLLKGSKNIVVGADTGNVNWRYADNSVVIGYGKWGTTGVLTNFYHSVDIGGWNPAAANTNTLNGVTNSIVLGYAALTHGSNTATIGDTNITVLYVGAGRIGWFQGAGSPETVVVADIGSFYSRKDGGAVTSFYVKESGTGNTGWIAK